MEKLKNSLQDNPLQGTELTPGVRKIRMAIESKGKGSSGGARVITFNILTKEQDGEIVLLLLYDKSDASTVKLSVVKDIVRDMGFQIQPLYPMAPLGSFTRALIVLIQDINVSALRH